MHCPCFALPKAFEHYRDELEAEVYGSMGIRIADTARYAAAVMRNFDCLAHRWSASSACMGTLARPTL